MVYFLKILTSVILPPGCLIVLLTLSLIFLFKNKAKLLKVVFSATLLVFYITSIPVTADILTHSLEYQFTLPEKLDGDVIVMLGRGATLDSPDFSGYGSISGPAANHLLTAARIHKKTNLPIILSGGQVYRSTGNESDIAKRQLMDMDILESKIIIENQSINTAENAKYTTSILNKYQYKRPILITSAMHMKRAVINFQMQSISAITPYPTNYITNTRIYIEFNSFIPSGDSIGAIRSALHEYLGIMQLWMINKKD